jgi:CBS domain-containing protein
MNPHVITVSEEQSAEEGVALFLHHHIHRIPVLRNGVPVSMVSQHDLLRLMVHKHESEARQ